MGVLGADSRRTLIHPASQSSGLRMTFWQENYAFIKDVYDMRHQKMAEWMENVEKSISRIVADKVYTSAEFKRERDNFQALCKDLERAEIKKWLQQILEILMAERGKEERSEQIAKLDQIIAKHEDLIPTVSKTQVKVDLYWKCYAYGDELSPIVEFLDAIMISSTRDIAPSCIENVEELIERQEKSLSQLENKRTVVNELINKGKQLLENPDKPKFLDSHVTRIKEGWDVTKDKATQRLELLNNTKNAWEGYYAGLDNIAAAFEKAEDEIKKVKKRFALQQAKDDLARRKEIFANTKKTIDDMYNGIQRDYDTMTLTLPEDKKDFVKKEVKGVTEKLEVVDRFKDKVDKIDEFVTSLKNFNSELMMVDSWMKEADNNLDQIKNHSDKMTPEDRVSVTMELQEDVGEKVRIIQQAIKTEEDLLPQGDTVPKDAQGHKDELKRIEKYVIDLQQRVMTQREKFSDDVKYWAEYRTGIKEFKPWLEASEKKAQEGLSKPSTLDGANALFATVTTFDQGCLKYFKILENAEQASLKMTTHKEADDEVKELKDRLFQSQIDLR